MHSVDALPISDESEVLVRNKRVCYDYIDNICPTRGSRHFSASLIDRLGSLAPFGGVLNLTRR